MYKGISEFKKQQEFMKKNEKPYLFRTKEGRGRLKNDPPLVKAIGLRVTEEQRVLLAAQPDCAAYIRSLLDAEILRYKACLAWNDLMVRYGGLGG